MIIDFFNLIKPPLTKEPTKGSFLTALNHTGIDAFGFAELEQELLFKDSKDRIFVVPKGFVADGSSIPRFLWGIVGHPFSFQNGAAGFLHDWLCEKQELVKFYRLNGGFLWRNHVAMTRKEKDELWRDACIVMGKSSGDANRDYLFLRTFGWTHNIDFKSKLNKNKRKKLRKHRS